MGFVFFIFLGCMSMKVNEEDEERKKKNEEDEEREKKKLNNESALLETIYHIDLMVYFLTNKSNG